MTNRYYVLPPPLNTYINGFYYHDTPMPYPRERILPIPWLNLKVNFGGAVRAYEADQTEPLMTSAESWWVGLWSTYHVIDWPQDVQFFMVEFKPGGAYPFLGLPLSELHDQAVSLDALWGQFAAEIRERLSAAPSVEAGFALLEHLLLERLNPAPHGLDTVQYAIAEIARQDGALSIRDLSDQIGISEKHLITQFKRMVGGTPKEIARLYRFQHVLSLIDPARPVDWTHIAHQSHYYDQAHFNKDFEAFTGCTPSGYLHLRRQGQSEHPERAAYLLQLPTG